MIKVRITFFNTKPSTHGDMTYYHSTTVREVIDKSYNTESHNRATAFARLFIKRLRAKDPVRYKNHINIRIELL